MGASPEHERVQWGTTIEVCEHCTSVVLLQQLCKDTNGTALYLWRSRREQRYNGGQHAVAGGIQATGVFIAKTIKCNAAK
jgi:hypothetical protein